MIIFCPYCGFQNKPLNNGFSSCEKCNMIYDDVSRKNIMLSAFWECRKKNLTSASGVCCSSQLSDKDLDLLQKSIDEGLSWDDFYKIVKAG